MVGDLQYHNSYQNRVFNSTMKSWINHGNKIKFNKEYFYLDSNLNKVKVTIIEKSNFYQFKCMKEDNSICIVHCTELYDIKHLNKGIIELLNDV